MSNSFYISEFGVFHKADINKQLSVNSILLDKANWEVLQELVLSSDVKVFTYLNSPKKIRINSYIGVISLNDIHVEILPKTSKNDDINLKQNRLRLLKMISKVHNLNLYQSNETILQLTDKPLIEILVERYLQLLSRTYKKGICREYRDTYGFEKFIKGKLLLSKQLRMPKFKMDRVHIEYDKLTFNRAENRLIKRTLDMLRKRNFSNKVRKQIREFVYKFDDLPSSQNIECDLKLWETGRHMMHYQPLFPFIRFILNNNSPETLKGRNKGISFLFQMEELFEKYVFEILKNKYQKPYSLKKQISSRYAAIQNGKNIFNLRPDIALFKDKKCISILDTKWKLLDQNIQLSDGIYSSNFGIKQGDIYQLFIYGEKYLNGTGEMHLIYPATSVFNEPLEPLILNDNGMKLNILPFDLDTDEIQIN